MGQGCVPALQLWTSKLLIDTATSFLFGRGPDLPERLLTLLVVQAGLTILAAVLGLAQNALSGLLGELVGNGISLQVLTKTNSLGVAFFEEPRFYDRLQNAYQEAGSRPLEIVLQVFRLGQSIVTLASAVLLLWRLHWAILPVLLVTSVPAFLIQSRYGYQTYWMQRQRAPELRRQRYYGMLLTSDGLVKEIRTYHLEGFFLRAYTSLFDKFYRENRKLTVRRSFSSLIGTVLSTLGWLGTAAYVVARTVGRTLTIGEFALYTQTISLAQGQLQSLMSGVSMLYSHALFMHNLFEFLTLPASDLSAGMPWTEAIRDIEFRGVSFRYPGAGHFVLHDVSFRVSHGQSLALAGVNGAGKTTIVKLLCRLYEPTSGEILLNGKSVARYSPHSIQDHVAVLFQDFGHYYLSARDNIGVGRVSYASDANAIQSAAQKSGADRVIEGLPAKYDTLLGRWFDEGVQLSGGEWQKLALARAFLRNGDVLILDEPTASLDAEAEAAVFESLLNDATERISILISHRFSTIRRADRIVVLENGKCVESGSHEELMAAQGQYARLFDLQARSYQTATASDEQEVGR